MVISIVILIIIICVVSSLLFRMVMKNNALNSSFNEINAIKLGQDIQIKALSSQLQSLSLEKEKITSSYNAEREGNIRLQSKIEAIEEKHGATIAIVDQFKNHLKDISVLLVQQNRDEVLAESKRNLSTILDPLQNDIKNFKSRIENIHLEDIKAQTSLQNEISNMLKTTTSIGNEAKNLTEALKSKPKMQGNWGEMILEKILNTAGLENNYIRQGIALDLRDDNNSLQQPDILLSLPNEQYVVIDSKVSLVNYEKYYNSKEDNARQLFFNSFIEDVKSHVDNLASKGYNNLHSNKIKKPLLTIGSILMFVPIEGVYYNISKNNDLHEYAWKKNIVLVGPYNIMPILRTIAELCRIERQNKNAQLLAELGSRIYGKIYGICEDIENLEKNINNFSTNINGIKTKINGKGGIVSTANHMKTLGIKNDKEIATNEIEDNQD